MDSVVKVRSLAKRFGRNRVIEDLDLVVGQGVTGLVGPNGAGKTTLLRCLATVLSPDSGTIEVSGLDLADRAERAQLRQRIGYLPQEPGLYPHFTAHRMLDYIAILKEIKGASARRNEVSRVLAEVDLAERSGASIRKLSGGMRQRLGIAQALIGEPDLVILDEPTVGLDPEQRMKFRTLVSRLGERRAVLLSTHQTEDIAALCERVVVFCGGRVMFDGTPRDLARRAEGTVWTSDERPPSTMNFWRTADGRYRVVGARPHDGVNTEPTVEDGYLLILGEAAKGTS